METGKAEIKEVTNDSQIDCSCTSNDIKTDYYFSTTSDLLILVRVINSANNNVRSGRRIYNYKRRDIHLNTTSMIS